LAVTSSTLPAEQDAVASQCLRETLRGTSFPVDATDIDARTFAAARQFVVHWSFPAPFPTDAAVALARSRGGGNGDADSCWQCGSDKRGDGACVAARTGWDGCIETEDGSCICFGRTCGSGGYVGTSGTIMMRETKPARKPISVIIDGTNREPSQ